MLKRNLFLAVAVIQFLFVSFVLVPFLWEKDSLLIDILMSASLTFSGMALAAGLFYRFVMYPEE